MTTLKRRDFLVRAGAIFAAATIPSWLNVYNGWDGKGLTSVRGIVFHAETPGYKHLAPGLREIIGTRLRDRTFYLIGGNEWFLNKEGNFEVQDIQETSRSWSWPIRREDTMGR